MEEYAYVIDFLPNGSTAPRGGRAEPLIYAIGESEFRLFTLVAKPGANVSFEQRIYIGSEASKRTAVDHVKSRIKYTDLTGTAMGEIEYAIQAIVMANEKKYVNFYNNAQPLSIKKHALEELPGMGKKTAALIIEARMKAPFTSFEDIATRVPSVKKPEEYIVKRIVAEISEDDHNHYIFVPRDAPRHGSR